MYAKDRNSARTDGKVTYHTNWQIKRWWIRQTLLYKVFPWFVSTAASAVKALAAILWWVKLVRLVFDCERTPWTICILQGFCELSGWSL